jgi:hypothetical protein
MYAVISGLLYIRMLCGPIWEHSHTGQACYTSICDLFHRQGRNSMKDAPLFQLHYTNYNTEVINYRQVMRNKIYRFFKNFTSVHQCKKLYFSSVANFEL